MINLKDLEKAVCSLSESVADFIRRERLDFDLSKIEHKGFNDLVSYVDKEAELRLVKGLRQILPEAGFITEEGTAADDTKSYTWIIDPLDGTTNFLHGLPVFAISIALMKDHEIVLGVVYEVNRRECFHATKGAQAMMNDLPIHVSSATSLSQSLLATGFPYYDFEKMPAYLSILGDLMQQSHGLRRMGSAAVDLAYVACGRFEGFFEYNLNSYDVAAGAFVVQQAGGRVSDFGGGQDYIFGRQILATNNAIHDAFLAAVKKRWY